MGQWFERAFRAFAVFMVSFIARVKFGARVSPDSDAIDENAVILCNHTSVWDFCYLIYCMRPRRVRFVATSIEFEKNKAYAWMLRALGVIKKTQGAPDAACVRQIMRVSRAGDIVALYPAGMTSFDGRPAWRVQPGTGKLARVLGVSVYAAVVNGGFISHPRYAHASYRGRVEIRVRRLFTASEAKDARPEELQAAIERALSFNDWDWQEKARAPFRGKNNARGVCRALYMCPNCRKLGDMREIRGGVSCGACGMTATRDAFGFFHAQKGNCPARMDAWVDMELKTLSEEIRRDDFCLRANVLLKRPSESGAGYENADAGELALRADGLTFSGAKGALAWRFSDFQYFVMNDVDFIHIYATNGAYRFVFDDPRLITRWFFAHRMLAGGEPR